MYTADPIFHFDTFWDLPLTFVINTLNEYTRLKKDEYCIQTYSTALLASLVYALGGGENKKLSTWDFAPVKPSTENKEADLDKNLIFEIVNKYYEHINPNLLPRLVEKYT